MTVNALYIAVHADNFSACRWIFEYRSTDCWAYSLHFSSGDRPKTKSSGDQP